MKVEQYAILSYREGLLVLNNYESIRRIVENSKSGSTISAKVKIHEKIYQTIVEVLYCVTLRKMKILTLQALNHPDSDCLKPNLKNTSSNRLCVSDLSSYESYPQITARKVDQRFVLVFENIPRHRSTIFKEHKYEPFLGNFNEVLVLKICYKF